MNFEELIKRFQQRIMKPLTLFLFLLTTAFQLAAQRTNSRGAYEKSDIEKMELGWMKNLSFGAAQPLSKNGRNYTAAQLDLGQKLASWWQSTYTPTGLLGELAVYQLITENVRPMTDKSYDFNEAEKDNFKALPNSYGITARLHYNVSKTATQKFTPSPGNWSYVTWYMQANNMQGIGTQAVFLSSPDEYYFQQIRYDVTKKGTFSGDYYEEWYNYRNFANSPNLKKYDHYLDPDRRRYNIIMTRDGKPLPFEQVTVGELITRLEKRFPVMAKSARDTEIERAKKGLAIIKEQMKNNYNEYVYLTHNMQIDIATLYNTDERSKVSDWLKTRVSYEKNGYTSVYYPLLRLKKGVKESCNNSGPQWMVFSLGVPSEKNYGGFIHLMDHFVSRFNYDYVYQYVFGDKKPTTVYSALK
ncbi:hypothetical protein JMG10_21555 [Nostoc ellipsosporum NOK]|nr:hypothetical protein [Nostoc ellipsosporum NOK]